MITLCGCKLCMQFSFFHMLCMLLWETLAPCVNWDYLDHTRLESELSELLKSTKIPRKSGTMFKFCVIIQSINLNMTLKLTKVQTNFKLSKMSMEWTDSKKLLVQFLVLFLNFLPDLCLIMKLMLLKIAKSQRTLPKMMKIKVKS